MTKIFEVLEELPREMQLPLAKAFEMLKKEIADTVTKAEFEQLMSIVRGLVEASQKADERLSRLEVAAQKAEERLARLELVMEKAEERLTRLELVMEKAEERLTRLELAMEKAEERLTRLELAMEKAEERLTRLELAMEKAEERLTRLELAMEKAEERLTRLELAMEKAEERLTRVENAVAELTAAQKKAEERLTRLESAVKELVDAQKRTEEEVRKLAESQGRIWDQLGGLAHTVGYRLEDEAMKALPTILKRDCNIEVIGSLKRSYIEVEKDKYIEVNIWGKAKKDGEEFLVIGEAKSQLRKSAVDAFLEKTERLAKVLPLQQIKVLITYQAHPDTEKYARDKGILVYYSYEL